MSILSRVTFYYFNHRWAGTSNEYRSNFYGETEIAIALNEQRQQGETANVPVQRLALAIISVRWTLDTYTEKRHAWVAIPRKFLAYLSSCAALS